MPCLSFIPDKATLVLLFNAAKRRVIEETGDVAELPAARIVTATEELNQIADDIRDARATPKDSPSALRPSAIDTDVRKE